VCSLVIAGLLNARDPLTRSVHGGQFLVLTLVSFVPIGLAAGALRGRRVLLASGAMVGIAVGPALWSGLPLLWVPAIAYVVAFARTRPARRPPWAPTLAAVVLPVILVAEAALLLISDTTERCAQTSNETVCAGVPPTWHLFAAAGLAVGAVALGWALARPQPATEISPRDPQVVALVVHKRTRAE
jgi:hypothetical protein